MENSREIAENKLRIESYEKYIEAAKNEIFELEHEIAEIDVEIAVTPRETKDKITALKEELSQLYAELSSVTEDKSGSVEEKSKAINEEINNRETKKNLIEDQEEKRIILLESKKERLEEKLNNQKDKIGNLTSKISKLSKINFELLDNPSHQIKVTLSYEENLLLEELVKKHGSNKSSVIRNMIKEFSSTTKERDALSMKLEKFVTEKRLEFQIQENEKFAALKSMQDKLEAQRKEFQMEFKFLNLQKSQMKTIEQLDRQAEIQLADIQTKIDGLMEQIIKVNKNGKILDQEVFENDSFFATEYFEPKDFNDLPVIIRSLKEENAVIVNLDRVAEKDRKRFVDLIFGAVVGIGGSIKKIDGKVLFLSPESHRFIEQKNNEIIKIDDKETKNFLKDLDLN
tara:strand:- start:2601 stop:3800 length:1200 start_codon:yes stop_codon:yes gene_type:complete